MVQLWMTTALATADTITVVDTASVTAADADTFGDKLSGASGTLAVSGYTNQNLADITTATVNVTTVNGATLDDEALATADTITVVDTASVTAADADTFGDKLSGDQAPSRSVVTQTKTSQTSPLPPSM